MMYGKNLCNLPLCPGIIRQENHGWRGVYSMPTDMATKQWLGNRKYDTRILECILWNILRRNQKMVHSLIEYRILSQKYSTIGLHRDIITNQSASPYLILAGEGKWIRQTHMDRSSWITEHFITQRINSGHDLINYRYHFADLAPQDVRFAGLVEMQAKGHKPHSPELCHMMKNMPQIKICPLRGHRACRHDKIIFKICGENWTELCYFKYDI